MLKEAACHLTKTSRLTERHLNKKKPVVSASLSRTSGSPRCLEYSHLGVTPLIEGCTEVCNQLQPRF